jgi:hypothetical protein
MGLQNAKPAFPGELAKKTGAPDAEAAVATTVATSVRGAIATCASALELGWPGGPVGWLTAQKPAAALSRALGVRKLLGVRTAGRRA